MMAWLLTHWVEIIGALFMLLYLWFEIKQHNAIWIIGIISAAFYVYIFYEAKFYADMALNIYYALASVYGLVIWQRGGFAKTAGQGTKPEKAVTRTSPRAAAYLGLAALAAFVVLAGILARCTDSPVPYGDAFTTALSIVAMWMLAHKLIEQWGVWFVVNTVSMGLYFWRGLYPTAVLFLIYSIASIIGYYQWKKTLVKGWMKQEG
jgi:nicotinamide mononucleotide transporter